MIRVLAFLGVLFLAAPASAQEAPKTKILANITYSKIAEKEMQLDLALPEGKGPFPTVICVHGGAWRLGKRQDLTPLIKVLAADGFAAVTVSYRLLPDAKFPDPLVDCKTAVRFLRANAEKYSIDKNHIGAVGYSAGGHLVCLMGTTDKDAAFDGTDYPDQSSKVQAVVSFFGPTDLSHYGKDDSAQRSIFEPLLGGRFKDKPELYKKASAISYVSKTAPPFLFLHGTNDTIVPIEQSRTMCAKLKEAGVSAKMIEIEGAGHGWTGADQKTTTKAMLEFFAENLKK